MFWYSGSEVLPASFFRYNSWKKYKIPDFENESKQNWYEFPYVTSMIKYLEE